MKNTAFSILFLLLSVILFESCAKRGTPDGGPIDEEPPRFVNASPANFSTNFDEEEIEILFNEYIKLEDAQSQIMISPPMELRPEITPLGAASKSVEIEIKDTLQENTTYSINFGRSIVDNNEGNPLNFFRYVFSTGSYIDSLSVSGTISDAYLKNPEPFISVMLYEVDSLYSDSIVYNSPPRYITNTLDSAITFQLENLKEGTYQLVAIKDLNSNYRFEPETEKIAFLEAPISVPTDSVFELTLFQEEIDFSTSRPGQQGQQHLIFGYEGELDEDSISIEMLPPRPQDFASRITKDRERDTLHYWYKPQLERDSLQFIVQAPNYMDTLLTRTRPADLDSLQINVSPTGTLAFNETVRILPNIPLTGITDSLLTLINQDTLPVPFTTEYDSLNNFIELGFEKEESQTYTFQALPGAFTDFFGTENDTLRAEFRTRSYSDYGNLTLNLQNIQSYPILVQLTNEEGEPLAEKQATSGSSFTFRHVPPGEYFIRIIYDTNENGIWDTGNYLLRRQPEEIIYYPELINVRANWDDTYLFTL